ncbi:helicase HerA domain-containing protein, partial [Pyrobaculum sp.]|uniref:helicase HerA domain-containing protein n=1 Tax=Pyrobaculum sp. TaxID=2004705 RepID=UPI003163E560
FAWLAALPVIASLAAPAALAFTALPLVFFILILSRDVGTPSKGIERNDSLFAILRPEEIWSVAKVSQLMISKALLVWSENKSFLADITKRALRQEHLAVMLLSRVRMMRAEEVAAVRQRVVHGREQAFTVAGIIDGKPASLAPGRPSAVDALTYDIAEFTPYAFMLLPFQCGAGTYRLGWDDRGREVCINPYELESPHAVVIGKTGSGKTTWSLAQALQAVKAGRLVVAIDPHGHWAKYATSVVDARRYMPSVKFALETGEEEFSDVDLLLDILRAAGVAVSDLHYTVLLNALERAGGSADLKTLAAALSRIRDPLNALAVDLVLGRIKSLARAEEAEPPTRGIVVVTTYGTETPAAVMRLIAWLFAYALWAKRTCHRPPCKPRLEIYIDEAHLLLRNLEALALAWRGLRKYGVRLVAISQDVSEFAGALSAIIANSDTKAVLAIDPTALNNVARAVGVDPSVLERVATEALPEERYAVIRFGGRAPVFIKLAKPEDVS